MKDRSGAAHRNSPTRDQWKNIAERANKMRAETCPLGDTAVLGDTEGMVGGEMLGQSGRREWKHEWQVRKWRDFTSLAENGKEKREQPLEGDVRIRKMVGITFQRVHWCAPCHPHLLSTQWISPYNLRDFPLSWPTQLDRNHTPPWDRGQYETR